MSKIAFPGVEEDYNGYKLHKFMFDGCECLLVEPKNPRPGMQWVWKAEFFTAFPKFELEMLNRGFYLAYITVGNTFGCPSALKHWDAFYQELTSNYGFAKRPILLGLSRGGLYIYNWAVKNTAKVACVYADNPVCDFKSWPGGKGAGPGSPDDWKKMLADYGFASDEEALAYRGNPVDNLEPLAKAGVPLVHAAGVDDEVVPIAENTDVVEARVKKLGGKIKVFRHPGLHHPHGLDDPAPLADYIIEHGIGLKMVETTTATSDSTNSRNGCWKILGCLIAVPVGLLCFFVAANLCLDWNDRRFAQARHHSEIFALSQNLLFYDGHIAGEISTVPCVCRATKRPADKIDCRNIFKFVSRYSVFGDWLVDTMPYSLTVYNRHTMKPVYTADWRKTKIQFAPDGKTAVIVKQENRMEDGYRIVIIDTDSWRVRVETAPGFDEQISWMPDGLSLWASKQGTMCQVNPVTGAIKNLFSGRFPMVIGLTGKIGYWHDGKVFITNATGAPGRYCCELPLHLESFNEPSMSFSPDGKLLVYTMPLWGVGKWHYSFITVKEAIDHGRECMVDRHMGIYQPPKIAFWMTAAEAQALLERYKNELRLNPEMYRTNMQ